MVRSIAFLSLFIIFSILEFCCRASFSAGSAGLELMQPMATATGEQRPRENV
jgi:hypothetical protein